MSLNKEHIDLNRLSDYFNGKMSTQEMHALELEAQGDPFLAEAMEGYEAHPEGLTRMSKLKKDHQLSSKSFFGSRTLAVLGIACLVYVIAWIVKPSIDENLESETMVTVDHPDEIEMIRESIDTFIFAELDEQITANEIVQNKQQMEESKENESTSNQSDNEIIDVEDENIIEIDHEIEPENEDQNLVRYAPSVYYQDLYVVDYSRLERNRTDISYIKYEFTGLPAEFEDEDAQENYKEFTEKQVDVPYMEYLEKSMEYFSGAHYKKALNRYLTIIEQYPEDLNAHFYGALCYYDMKKYDKAFSFLDKIVELELAEGYIAFRQEAKWYKTKSLVKLGRKAEAIILIDEIIMEGLFYSPEAIKLKAKL